MGRLLKLIDPHNWKIKKKFRLGEQRPDLKPLVWFIVDVTYKTTDFQLSPE